MKRLLAKLQQAKETGFKSIDEAIVEVKKQFEPLIEGLYSRPVAERDFKLDPDYSGENRGVLLNREPF